MRIATQMNLLSSVKVLVPIHCLSNSGVPGTTRERLLRWAGVKGILTGRRANRKCLLATVKRDIGPVACSCVKRFLLLSAALFLLACKTMYRSSAGVVPRGRHY
ncbi:hypothetical protein TNCV_1063451 [Trichonephila clavipes]|nr:hypothetical protein TNCV_1063451 [Trichonephila clavipes]